jgi:TRAP-type transport system periplasmic protein
MTAASPWAPELPYRDACQPDKEAGQSCGTGLAAPERQTQTQLVELWNMRYLLFAMVLALSVLVAACAGGTAPPPAAPAAPAAPASGAATKIDPLTIRFAHTGSETHPMGIGAKIWKPMLEARSGGAIQVQEFGNSVLGGERELIEGTKLGTIDMVTVAADGALPSFVPVMQLMGLPFIFRDREHAYKVLDGEVGQTLQSALDADGLAPIGWWELGFRNITTRAKPINSPGDLQGLKMRVQESPVWLEFMKSLGALPTPIAFNELYTALQQGVVDGQENPIATITSMKFYEVQKHVALTGHVYTANAIMANKGWWEGLTQAQRDAITDSIRESMPVQRNTIRDSENEGIEFLKTQGVSITTPDKAPFAEATKNVPNVVSHMVPPDLVQKVRDTN